MSQNVSKIEDNEEKKQEDDDNETNEHIYIGNMHEITNDSNDIKAGHLHTWTMFITTDEKKLVAPLTIKDVTYFLHNAYEAPRRQKFQSPFFLRCTGKAVFHVECLITFRSNVLRPTIHCRHLLSFDKPTTLTDSEDPQIRHEYDYLFIDYDAYKANNNILINNDKIMAQINNNAMIEYFVKTSNRLEKNLKNRTKVLKLEYYKIDPKAFSKFMRRLLDSIPSYSSMNIPDTIIYLISTFALLHDPITDLIPQQSVQIYECSDCNAIITPKYFNHLSINQCKNMTITFSTLITQCEVNRCENIIVEFILHL
jgi:transcription initiation factor IIF auxiliary subunit